MTVKVLEGQRTWSMSRDEAGHRTYKIKHIVESEFTDGPYAVSNCPGLPVPGAIWSFDGDVDNWAFCIPEASYTIHDEKEGERARFWAVENTFTTKPWFRCNERQVEDPLLEPIRVSGGFVKDKQEYPRDRLGNLIQNSSFERITGPLVEFDRNNPTVRIEQNVANLELSLFSSMQNCVNAYPLWGLPERTIFLANTSWERHVYGQCYYYYTRSFEFYIDFNSHDRWIIDEGRKVLRGNWLSGSGCELQLTINATTGAITAFNYVDKPGKGYPPDKSLADELDIPVMGGSGGVVRVSTNSEGEIVAPVSIVSGGRSYFTKSGTSGKYKLKAYREATWQLDTNPPPNPKNPNDYSVYKDVKGENSKILLDGSGRPLVPPDSSSEVTPYYFKVEAYSEVDFLLLGVPTSF